MARTGSRMLNGRCECRAVRYRVADEFLYAANCHCSNCRAGTGSAFKPFAGIERDKLRLVEGSDLLLVWGDETANHTRCGVCGSLLYSVVRDGAYVHVAMGSLEDAPSIRPTEHSSTAQGRVVRDHRTTRLDRREYRAPGREAASLPLLALICVTLHRCVERKRGCREVRSPDEGEGVLGAVLAIHPGVLPLD